METFNVGKIEEFEDKSKKVVTIGDEEVGVFRLGDEFFAWRNICPHQGGPVCQGRLYPLVKENLGADMKSHGRVYNKKKLNIVCPWHGLEFDIATGKHPGNPNLALDPCRLEIKKREIYVYI